MKGLVMRRDVGAGEYPETGHTACGFSVDAHQADMRVRGLRGTDACGMPGTVMSST